MLESDPDIRLVITTVGSREEASTIGRTLVEEHLVACATILPEVQSIYCWRGTLEDDREILMLLKTHASRLDALEARLHQLHSYDTPEFLVLHVDAGSQRYLEWMKGHFCVQPEPAGQS